MIEPLCAACVVAKGLCHRCARDVLPRLKEPTWLRAIMGRKKNAKQLTKEDAAAALRAAAAVAPLPVSPAGLTYRQRRAMTKAIKARKRRGAGGLARSIRAAA